MFHPSILASVYTALLVILWGAIQSGTVVLKEYPVEKGEYEYVGAAGRTIIVEEGDSLKIIEDYTSPTSQIEPLILNSPNTKFGPLAPDLSTGRIFISSNTSSILMYEGNNTLTWIHYLHPWLRNYELTRLAYMPGTNWLLGLSHFSPHFMRLDWTNPSSVGFTIMGNSALKELELFEDRYVVIMTEPGDCLYVFKTTLPSYKFQLSPPVTAFSGPGRAIFKIAYYSLFAGSDLLLIGAGDGYQTTDISLVDLKLPRPTVIRTFGAMQTLLSNLQYLNKTSYFLVSTNIYAFLYNAETLERTDIDIGRHTYVKVLPNSNHIAVFSEREKTITVFYFEHSACALGCFDCTVGMKPDSCISCNNGFTLSAGKCIPTSCPAGSLFSLDTNSCAPVSTPGAFLNTPYTLGRAIKGCKNVSIYGESCISCDPSFNAVAYKLSNCAQDKNQCPNFSYQNNATTCLSCHFTCAQCSGPERDQCTSCRPGFVLKADDINPNTLICASDCAATYFFSALNNKCMRCGTYCDECLAANDLKCLKCSEGTFLNGGYCSYECPVGFIPNEITRVCDICSDDNCEPCDPGQIGYKGKCYPECPPNTGTWDYRRCYDCYDAKCKYLILPNKNVVVAKNGQPKGDGEDGRDGRDPRMGLMVTFAGLGFAVLLLCVCAIVVKLWKKKPPTAQNMNGIQFQGSPSLENYAINRVPGRQLAQNQNSEGIFSNSPTPLASNPAPQLFTSTKKIESKISKPPTKDFGDRENTDPDSPLEEQKRDR